MHFRPTALAFLLAMCNYIFIVEINRFTKENCFTHSHTHILIKEINIILIKRLFGTLTFFSYFYLPSLYAPHTIIILSTADQT